MKKKWINQSWCISFALARTLRIMKLTIFIFFVAILQVPASIYSQNTRMTIVGQNLTLEKIFDIIENQSEFSFFYNVNQLDISRKVNINEENQLVDRILGDVLTGTDLTFTINNKLVIIHKVNEVLNPVVPQDKTVKKIKGKVTDPTGSPIPGASVVIKDSSTGIVTDIDGNFSLEIPSNAKILVFSFLGMLTQEVTIGNQNIFNVQFREETIGIEEVVAIGYGTQKKSHLTGAISKVTNKGLDQIPTARGEEALIGKVSGVNIQMSDASAGAAPTIRVRGIGSITADASPLIVLDGVVVASDYLGNIDMNDVETIEVLKDAASAAIYGSRGGNGVIMVTTKKGKEGKTQFTFNGYRGIKYTFPNKRYEPFSTISEWKNYVLENNNGVLTDQMKFIELLGTENRWADVFFDEGIIENYSISARGGNEKTKFTVSGNYLRDDGVLLTDYFKKMNVRINMSTKVNNVIEFGGSVNPSYTKQRKFADGVHAVLRVSPWLPIYHDEKSIAFVNKSKYPNVKIGDYAMERHYDGYILPGNTTGTVISTSSSVGPVPRILEQERLENNFNLFTNLYLKLNIFNGFSFTATGSATYLNSMESNWTGELADTKGPAGIKSTFNTETTIHLANENIFSYDKTIGKHDINAIAGMAFESWNSTFSGITGTGYANDYIHTINAASVISGANTNIVEESLAAVIGRFNYSYDNKLLVSLSARYDGSSRFGLDTKWGFFPAGSVGWILSNEDFIKSTDWISNLKARVSYGVTGNNKGIGYYSSLARLQSATSIINGGKLPGFNPINIANPDLGWEKSVEIGPGVDFGFLNNRFTLSLDYYIRRSNDLLLDQAIPSVTGFDVATVNIGEVKNSGFEMEFGATVLSEPWLNWTTSINLSHNTNELIDFAGASGLITYVDPKRPSEYIALEGNPISSFYGYKYLKDIPLEYLNDPFYPINAKGQSVYVQDLNKDGVITPDDRTILGSPYPKFMWGFNNTFNVKDFDLTFTLQGSHGAKTLNLDPQYWEKHFDTQMAYKTAFPDKALVQPRIMTDLVVQDASYVALRSINVGYKLPGRLSGKIGLSSARIYVAGQNILYLMAEGYTSFNPEGVTDASSPLRGGYQVGAPPVPKAVTLGLNIEF